MYIDILRRLRVAVRRKFPSKMGNQRLVCPSRQCSSTPVHFGQGFLSKEKRDNTGGSPYSPDLASADFYQFPQMKSAKKEWRHCDANGIIKNATEEPKMFSQNGLQECSHHLYSRWQKFIII